MWVWLVAPLALAHPPLVFPREGESTFVRSFAGIVGDGPAWGHPRQAGGPVTAWIFPDGVIEHAEIRMRGQPVEVRRYDAAGHLFTTVRTTDDRPLSVTVHEPGPWQVELEDYAPHDLGPVRVWLPPAAVITGGVAHWSDDDLEVRMQVLDEAADPFSGTFRDELLAACGCVLEGHGTAWIHGQRAARYRVRLPDPDRPWTGELWAAAVGDHTLVVTSLVPADAHAAPADGLFALAPGRALVALIRLQETP